MPIGEKIKKYRTEKGLTQSELANQANVSRITLGFYERGENQPPFDVAVNIAKALEIPVANLIDNPFNIFKTPEYVLMEWLEAFGYKVMADESEGYLYIRDAINNLDHEITGAQLKDLEKSIGDYTKFQVQELFKKCGSLPVKKTGGDINAKT